MNRNERTSLRSRFPLPILRQGENENQALCCFILIKEVDVRMLKLMICRRADVFSHKLNRTTFMKDITKYAKSPKAS